RIGARAHADARQLRPHATGAADRTVTRDHLEPDARWGAARATHAPGTGLKPSRNRVRAASRTDGAPRGSVADPRNRINRRAATRIRLLAASRSAGPA